MANIICDSCVWIALFNPSDTQHEKAQKFFQKQEQENHQFFITNYLDIECISVLGQKAGIAATREWIAFREEAWEIKTLHIDANTHQDIVKLYLSEKNTKLSLIDISLLNFSKKGFTVVTFDQKLEKQIQRSLV